MPLTIVNTFLLVANKEGRSVTELAKAAGIHNSKMSRQLADLFDTNRYGAPGLELIVQRHDVYGPRSTNCFKKGQSSGPPCCRRDEATLRYAAGSVKPPGLATKRAAELIKNEQGLFGSVAIVVANRSGARAGRT